MLRRLPFIFLSLSCFACAKQDEVPQQYSSSGFRMDGSRVVADIGVPQQVTVLTVGDTNHPNTFPPSSVVPLGKNNKYKFAFAAGSSLCIGNETSSEIIAALPNEKNVIQILTDATAIYGIHADGKIEAFDHQGTSLWKHEATGFMGAAGVLSDNDIIVTADSGIYAIDTHTGKDRWFYPTAIRGVSTVFDAKAKLIIAALSFNSSDASDSIICFSLSGVVKTRCAFSGTRIISNLCLCGNNKDKIAFGYIGKPKETDAVRSLKVAVYTGVAEGHPKFVSDHEVSYLATNIASNGQLVLASGFEQAGGSLESGIDAFYADDTTRAWQRRFTEPLVAPVAISNKFAYFTLSFVTEAEVPAKSIFYTLDLSTGKTLGELPITGVRNGSASGMPMPLGESEFVLTDASRSVLYFLKP